MPPKVKLPDEDIIRVVEMRRAGFSVRDIAKSFGVGKSTIARYLTNYQPQGGVKGEPPPSQPINKILDKTDLDGTVELLTLDRPATVEELMALCNLDESKWIPQYYKPNTWQGFYRLPHGRGHQKVQLIQSKCCFKRVITEELEDAILRFIRETVTPLPKPKLTKRYEDSEKDGYMVSWGLWDAHLGMYAWNAEVGEDYDMNIAYSRICNSVDDMIAELSKYKISRFVMPIGNDFMHFDSVRMKTAMGDHWLDVDTRYGKVYLAGLKCLTYMIQRALEICNDVRLYYIPGNHDTTSSFTLTAALEQRFHADDRVKVDLRFSPRKAVLFGGTLLGFDHGHEKNPNQMATTFSTEPGVKKYWSSSTYREIQTGHKHQRWEKMYEGVIPTNGVLIRRNPSLSNVDCWHYNKALTGEPVKSVEAWRYDTSGYRGSHVVWARDDSRKEDLENLGEGGIVDL